MFAYALSLMCYFAPLPEDGAVLLARSVVKSEDGKHTVQLATFGFPMNERDQKLLLTIMNSDPYLHHFRPRAVFLTVGEKWYKGGPRLVGWHPWSMLVGKAPPQWPWTCSFVLPADVDLAGKLKFSYTDNTSDKVRPAAEPFAKLEITEKNLKAATIPFRATVTATGTHVYVYSSAEGGTVKKKTPFVAFQLDHHPYIYDRMVGDSTPTGDVETIHDEALNRPRHAQGYESILTFKEAPPAGAAVRVKLPGFEGWYKAETTIEKPKEKK